MEKEVILVIDDDLSLAEIIRFNLEEEGYKVFLANDGQQGVLLFNKNIPDLVITDIKMKGMTGLEVLRFIKQQNEDIPVIIITAFGSIDNAISAIKAGAFDYITKPFEREDFKLKVKKALQFKNLKTENKELKTKLTATHSFSSIQYSSSVMEKLINQCKKVAPTDIPVLIQGETGTGKELIAHSIHNESGRKGEFVAINCGAIPGNLLESELFGYEKGAFTGAFKSKPGKVELADKGTLFLDEIGDMEIALQVKLLRFLEDQTNYRLGDNQPRKLDIRVISATNKDIEKLAKTDGFRSDLFYRLGVVVLKIPPLRERKEEIPYLLKYFCRKLDEKQAIRISDEAMEALTNYPWEGNVRELFSFCRWMLVSIDGDELKMKDIPEKYLPKKEPELTNQEAAGIISLEQNSSPALPLDDQVKKIIFEVLDKCDGNRSKAARILGIPRHKLLYKLEKYGYRKNG